MTEKKVSREKLHHAVFHFVLRHYGWILIVLAPSILFLPMLVSGKVLFWGTPLMQFVPWRDFAFETIREGYLPLWNPWLGMGAPLIANYQSALFYPPNLILFVTGPAWGHGLLVLLHIIWAGIGMRLFVRRLGLGELAQVVAGLCFSLSGYVVARAGFLSINACVSWLPWTLLGVENLIIQFNRETQQSKLIKPILILSVILCMQWLSGHAQTSWYSAVLAIVWLVWRAFERGRWMLVIRACIGFVLTGLVGFLLSSIQLIPTLEYLLNSHRASEVEQALAFTYSLWPWRLLGLLMPNLFGNPATGNYWGYANFWEDALYIGVLPLILAFFAVWRGIKHSKYSSLIVLQLGLMISTLVLALGKNTPIFPFLFENIPTFDIFQAPTRWSLILEFSLVILAAIGADLWQKQEVLRLFWVRLGTAAGAATVAFALIVGSLLTGIQNTFSPALALAGLGVLVSGIIAWRRRIQPAKHWPTVIGLFIALDLLVAGSGLNPSVPKELYDNKSHLAEMVDVESRVYMDSKIEEEVKFDWTHRFDSFSPEVEWRLVRDVGLPNTTLLDRIHSANNFDPILPDRYVKWMERIEQLPSGQLEDALRMMAVGSVAEIDPSKEFQIRYRQVQSPNLVWVVGEALWVETAEEANEKVFDPHFDYNRVVVIEGTQVTEESTRGTVLELEVIEDDDPNRLEVQVELSETGWLVISETYYPGWKAFVDGESVPLYRANYLFKAIHVPAGPHHVVLQYKPTSFLVGGFLTVISWIMFGVIWWKTKEG